ncbi:MAG: galactose-1-epimerase, partial [Bacteroidota bacterium]|nr:galactose-1-epimerase [Bacteroidota bacterium]
MITIKPFDTTQDGHPVLSVKLKNSSGMEAHFITYGAILQRLIVPDAGGFTDVVLGYNDLHSYEEDTFFMGQLVGRSANRIANATVSLDGKKVALSANEGTNHLHGGFEGFGKKIWEVAELEDEVVFSYLSIDGEEGYPGNLETKMFV